MARSKPEKYYVQRLRVRVMSPPFDMMRYDRCVPRTEEDASKLYRITGVARCDTARATPEDHIIEFLRYTPIDGPPTVARWRSFACEILSWETT